MKRMWNSLNIAFSMYSRIPSAQCDWNEENMKYVMCFFPWIGIVIGLLSCGWHSLAVALELNDPLRIIVWMLIPVLVSGGIHLDGLLDTADAMSSWRTRERRLEILKDSHAGAFAIIICAVHFMMLYGILDMVSEEMIFVYSFTFVISRSLSAFSVVTFPKASVSGTVAGFSKNAETRIIQVTVICYVILCGMAMILIQPVYGAAALIGAALTFGWYYRMAMKNFGGINGDLAGCFLTVCEAAMPTAMVICSLFF